MIQLRYLPINHYPMPIEKNFGPSEQTSTSDVIEQLNINTMNTLNDLIKDMSREEIAAEIDSALEEFPDDSLFLK